MELPWSAVEMHGAPWRVGTLSHGNLFSPGPHRSALDGAGAAVRAHGRAFRLRAPWLCCSLPHHHTRNTVPWN
eukprot:gene18256-biopygen14473